MELMLCIYDEGTVIACFDEFRHANKAVKFKRGELTDLAQERKLKMRTHAGTYNRANLGLSFLDGKTRVYSFDPGIRQISYRPDYSELANVATQILTGYDNLHSAVLQYLEDVKSGKIDSTKGRHTDS